MRLSKAQRIVWCVALLACTVRLVLPPRGQLDFFNVDPIWVSWKGDPDLVTLAIELAAIAALAGFLSLLLPMIRSRKDSHDSDKP